VGRLGTGSGSQGSGAEVAYPRDKMLGVGGKAAEKSNARQADQAAGYKELML